MIVKCVGYEWERQVLRHEANVNFGNDFFETWGVDENRGRPYVSAAWSE